MSHARSDAQDCRLSYAFACVPDSLALCAGGYVNKGGYSGEEGEGGKEGGRERETRGGGEGGEGMVGMTS